MGSVAGCRFIETNTYHSDISPGQDSDKQERIDGR